MDLISLLTMPSLLYRHYKNKPYKFLGTVRHSETLEEMVLYETRYENPSGRIWVRPKEMFFEDIEINGQKKARFENLSFHIQETNQLGESEIATLAPLIKEIFGEWDPKWFNSTARNHTQFHLCIAFVENKAVGFKLGYEKDAWDFYSWLGGVLPDYRGVGLAQELMNTQHRWCEQKGYRTISTKTQNRFQNMLILNLKSGFQIIGTHRSEDSDGLKIMLEKRLK